MIKTLIYGVKSSGNQEERGLKKTARLSAEEPQVSEIFQNDIFAVDCLSREDNVQKGLQRTSDLEVVVNCGGFTLKGVLSTGSDPPDTLSTDYCSINVVGMK